MGLGIEYYVVEIERLRWRKQQIEILERLGKEEALHRVRLLLCDHTLEGGISFLGLAMPYEVAKERLSHP